MGLSDWLINKISKTLTKNKPAKRGYLCDFERICHEVRPADVLLFEGRNYTSKIIQRITQSPWSHAVLYIGRLHDIDDPLLRESIHKFYKGRPSDQLLIESIIGKGTIIAPIRDYQEDHIRICRPAGLSYKDAQRVIAYAIKKLGREYSIRHIFDIGRFLIASRFIPRRWKSTLFEHNAGQATQDICSVMIAEAFMSIKFPILPLVRENGKHDLELIPRNPKLFTPSDFDYSPYFNIIKYPIFSVSETTPYRNLPWREDLMSNDEVGVQEIPKSKGKEREKEKEHQPNENETSSKT